jgi:phytoene synthase
MTATPEDYARCAEILRDGDRDVWLASLFAPEIARPHIHALWAFGHEIARISLIVSEPMLGEIRLQWWREALEGQRDGEAAQNPVAAAVLDTVGKFGLPRSALLGLIEARKFDLYQDPMPSLNDLEGYCGETFSALFRLTTIVLADGGDPGSAEASGHAGVSLGMTRVLRDLPLHARRGQCFIPGDVLARHGAVVEAVSAGLGSPASLAAVAELRGHARKHFERARLLCRQLPSPAASAFVLLAVVPLYLRLMDKRDFNPFSTIVEPAQWRRQWAMWRW